MYTLRRYLCIVQHEYIGKIKVIGIIHFIEIIYSISRNNIVPKMEQHEEETLCSLWKCELNVGEYNTIGLVEENTKKKTTIDFLLLPSLKYNRKVRNLAITLVGVRRCPHDGGSVCAKFQTDNLKYE